MKFIVVFSLYSESDSMIFDTLEELLHNFDCSSFGQLIRENPDCRIFELGYCLYDGLKKNEEKRCGEDIDK